MNLLIDIGNSRIKWCLYNSVENKFGLDGAMFYDNLELPALFSEHWSHLESPDRVVISNVSNQNIAEIIDIWVLQVWQIKTEYAKTEAFSCGVRNAYSIYSDLGTDRWMAMIAAWQRFCHEKRPVCVVDCGTATTIDGISESGQHLGGFIIPGFELMQETLVDKTSAIKIASTLSSKTILPSTNFSNSTEEGVHSGCYLATLSIIDRIFITMQNKYGKQINCIITGGNAELLIQKLAEKFEYEPKLVLHGLAIFSGKTQ